MAEGKVYRLEYLKDGEWKTWGVYPERFINQLVAGVCDLCTRGYKPYDSIRVTEAS